MATVTKKICKQQIYCEISEASFVTSVEESNRVDQCTQTPPSGKGKPRTLQRFKVNVTDSPTISITPPHSLDYAPKAGWGSPNGSATPNGMVSSRSGATTVLLSPGYLQGPCQCNASIKVRD
ncbi:uncharacterized protein LOC135082467 [Ostrinia nubilalis]|uniref:uncharacterized protein LOC135082467 n=1 Tax=Ostrinia nubilalis TaxID=29057 RepID=UPI00308265AC